jgi:hypothetical protein
MGYSGEKGTFPRVTHPSAATPEGIARLACVKPAASVRSEPGSNSQVEMPIQASLTDEPLHITPVQLNRPGNVIRLICSSPIRNQNPPNSEADTPSSGSLPRGRYANVQSVETKPNRPHIPSSRYQCQRAYRQSKLRCVIHDPPLPAPPMPRSVVACAMSAAVSGYLEMERMTRKPKISFS